MVVIFMMSADMKITTMKVNLSIAYKVNIDTTLLKYEETLPTHETHSCTVRMVMHTYTYIIVTTKLSVYKFSSTDNAQ